MERHRKVPARLSIPLYGSRRAHEQPRVIAIRTAAPLRFSSAIPQTNEPGGEHGHGYRTRLE